nr:hypothetical protein [Tanacetum cinerariifolium]
MLDISTKGFPSTTCKSLRSMIELVTAATSQVSAASATISAAKPSIPAAALIVVAAYTRRRQGVIIRDPEEELSSKTPAETPKLKDKGKGILIEIPKPMKKKDQIELDVEYARKLHEEINKDIDWDAAIDHVKQKSMGNQYIKRYHGMKKRPQTEINDEDDDVFTEATPLGRKVAVVDYHIVLINNKPRFKIIKADETHQLYISFITLLKNFDKEDLEDLWGILKERFSTSKPSNFSDEYLLTTLRIMFEKPDGQNVVWRSQSSVHGQALKISTFKVHTGTIGKCNKTSSRRRKCDVIGAAKVHKITASGISARMMVEHILHKAKDQE